MNASSASARRLRIAVPAAVLLLLLAAAVFLLRDQVLPGWHEKDGIRYYVTFPFLRASGLTAVGGSDYLFSDYGEHALLTGWHKWGGERYCSDENGRILKGPATVDGVEYGFDPETGILYQNVTRIEDGKLWYYGPAGFRVFGIVELNGDKYAFSENGNLLRGLQVIDGKTYYFDPETESMVFGLRTVGGATYYFGEDGAAVSGGVTVNGQYYDFGEDGKRID